ncbi:MAG: adenine phosphoribosyltransferase [Nanoarchaeota archaeon]|nr:adenine phosphoribosyltransferase [Nanoarchaeota archaeon]
MDLKSHIRSVPDFPKKGILFYDITTLVKDAKAFKETIDQLYGLVKGKKYDKVAAIESRGFIFAAPLALMLGCGFVIIRKPGKLPAEVISQSYSLEYGKNTLEVHKDAIKPGERVLLVDDLLATGGTMEAAASLVEKLGGKVETLLFVINLAFLPGAKRLEKYDKRYLITYNE